MAGPLKEILNLRGAGRVYDARSGRLSRPNGGRITPLIGVHHIPVIRNRKGIGDFVTLGEVLIAQGLMVQFATDDNGHVCIFTDANRLCYQAAGANFVGVGVEHMHWSTSEDWQREQLRAAAWIYTYLHRRFGVPMAAGHIVDGGPRGQIKVVKKGWVSHQRVSRCADYNDRSDPGPEFDWAYVRHAAFFYLRHGGFYYRRSGRKVQA